MEAIQELRTSMDLKTVSVVVIVAGQLIRLQRDTSAAKVAIGWECHHHHPQKAKGKARSVKGAKLASSARSAKCHRPLVHLNLH